MSTLVQDEDPKYLLVKRNENVIAYYPIDKLKELKEKFKDICLTSDFINYRSLDYFRYSIYFLEFLEYFLDHLHSLFPDVSPYIKNKTKLTKNESIIMNTESFKILMDFAGYYLYYKGSYLMLLFDNVKNELNNIIYTKLKKKEQNILIRLYLGFLHFLQLLIEHYNDIDESMILFIKLRDQLLQGKLNKSQPTFNQSSLTMIYNLFEYDEMLKYRKDLLSKFRLFQRKYLSEIAKLRKIGHPNITKEKLLEIKKGLNKNKNIDYKAYEIFCLYVLSKKENEDIYDFLAGIHKNSNGSVIHKNIKNNKIANIKETTKKIHHKEYVEKSKEILKSVEDKIKEHGDIIDIKTKHQVERIRKLFDSEQFKNMTLSFGNNNSPSIGGKIIQDCKTIRAINKQIDEMIKEHMREYMKKEHLKKKEEKRKELLKLLDIKNKSLTNKKKITYLLGYDLLIKTKNLSKEEINLIEEIEKKLKN